MSSRPRIGVTQTQRLALNVSMHAALRVLQADALGLTAYLEEQAAGNSALVLRPVLPAPGDWLPRWNGMMGQGGSTPVDSLATHGPSLLAHVSEAIPRLFHTPQKQRLALALTEALEPSGWLGGNLLTIAAETGFAPAAVEAALKLLQTIEPVGLFARDLRECLSLQAQDIGALDPPMQVMLDRLDLVASGDWAQLARLAGVDSVEMERRFRLIRSFNPKPGTAFNPIASPLREPDLTVRQAGEAWEVALNRSSLPSLEVRESEEGAAQARAIVKLVESRNSTLLSVAKAVLHHQRAALDAGPAALRPLTMQSLAAQLGLHKSTISRVVAGTAVDTPHGTWWLRELFSQDMGADIGAAALRDRLARLVGHEDAAHPLSDEALAEALSGAGVSVARRTVAKYRAALHIPPAYRRKKR
jgi:RNA polymerase sigma-54 factor